MRKAYADGINGRERSKVKSSTNRKFNFKRRKILYGIGLAVLTGLMLLPACGIPRQQKNTAMANPYRYEESVLYVAESEQTRVAALWTEDHIPFFIEKDTELGTFAVKSAEQGKKSRYQEGLQKCLQMLAEQEEDNNGYEFTVSLTDSGFLYLCVNKEDGALVGFFKLNADSGDNTVPGDVSGYLQFLEGEENGGANYARAYATREGNICYATGTGLAGYIRYNYRTIDTQMYNDDGDIYFGNNNVYQMQDNSLYHWEYEGSRFQFELIRKNGISKDKNAVFVDYEDNLYIAGNEGILYLNLHNKKEGSNHPVWELIADAGQQTVFNEDDYECRYLIYDKVTEEAFLCVTEISSGRDILYKLDRGEGK